MTDYREFEVSGVDGGDIEVYHRKCGKYLTFGSMDYVLVDLISLRDLLTACDDHTCKEKS